MSLMRGHGFPPRSMSFRSFPLVLNAPVPAPSFILLMRSSVAGLHRSESRLLNPFVRVVRSVFVQYVRLVFGSTARLSVRQALCQDTNYESLEYSKLRDTFKPLSL